MKSPSGHDGLKLHRRRGWSLLPVLLVLLVLAACGPAAEPVPAGNGDGPSSVLLISIDTLRADHLGAYGYGRPTSPFLDELAREGTLFEAAVSSAPWTLPAHASLLSGIYPSTHRAVDGSEAIAPGVTMAAELFQEAGYATGAFVASWFVSQRYGFQRGFQRFEDFQQTLKNNTRQKIQASQVVDAAAGWLQEHAGQPFFLFVHLYDPHFNYNPPPEHAALFDTGYRGPREPYRKYSYYPDHPVPADLMAQEIALYDGEIHYADAQLRRLHQVLEAQGVADDVLVVVTADHGEEFFERGSWGHAHTLYEEVIRVPLIMRGPGIRAGQRWADQVRHVDILPTLIDLFSLRPPGPLHGESLGGILRQGREQAGDDAGTGAPQAPGRPRPAFMESSRFASNIIGIRRGGWKMILDLTDGGEELLHLAADPGEEDNLAGSEAERLQAMHEEALAAAGLVVPDRWLLRWYADGDAPLEGRVTTTGSFFMARTRGGGGAAQVDMDARGLSYRLEPGGVLEMAVLPVDAELTVEPPRSGRRVISLALGRESQALAGEALAANSHQADLLAGIPTPLAPAAAFWLEQSRGSGSPVHLSEDEIKRLESLGYAMR